MTKFKYNSKPLELSAEKINDTISLLDQTIRSMRANRNNVQAFTMEQLKQVFVHLGDQVDIIKNHSDDQHAYKYLQYLQYAVNVLESYATKYQKF